MNPMTFCKEVVEIIGDDLRSLNAVPAGKVETEQVEVCFFRVRDRTVAIEYRIRDGAACYVSPPGLVDLSQYESWESLWSALGMTKDIDTDEGLTAYLRLFPNDHDEFMAFMGKSLVRYFGRG